MKVSTQVQNYAVQKVWTREGFFIKESFDTIHINSMLGYTLFPARNLNYSITHDDIKKYGITSGDLNPVHFDDDFAIKKGFYGRIAHGLIPVAWISRYFGTEFPGHGTLFLNYSYYFLKPLYPEKKYTIIISFPYYEESRDRYLSLVRILDEHNDVCLLSYHHLLKR